MVDFYETVEVITNAKALPKPATRGSVEKFLLQIYGQDALLKGLHSLASSKRVVLRKDMSEALVQEGILAKDGTMPDTVKDIMLEAIKIDKNGRVVLEL